MNEEDTIKEHEEELERWQIMHALKGQGFLETKHCEEQCGDPACDTGCLNQDAQNTFRAQIMRGVKIVRDSGSDRFPPSIGKMASCHCGSRKDFRGEPLECADALCRVTGCLRKPAFQFRDLIRLAQKDEIFTALRKKTRK